jgi:hypothetical protein
MSIQNSSAVSVTGGSINGTPIGGTSASSANFTSVSLATNSILPKTSGVGFKVDSTNPTFPWFDLLGAVHVKTTGVASNVPNLNVYQGGIRQYQFTTGDEVANEFHIPHDYVPGSQLYIHVHFSQASTTLTSTNTVTWGMEASYGAVHTPFSTPVTFALSANASTVQYFHNVVESVLSGSAGTTSQLATTALEVDGVILVRTFLSTFTGLAQPFAHYIDIHYQSVGTGTKWKNHPYYST